MEPESRWYNISWLHPKDRQAANAACLNCTYAVFALGTNLCCGKSGVTKAGSKIEAILGRHLAVLRDE